MTTRVVSESTYIFVLLALLVLTVVTYLVSRVDLGKLNVVIALAIAATKVSLVALYFMHARYSSRLTRVVIGAGLAWLTILLTLTLTDYVTRTKF
ncbi:MAG TPA: cytochrome C oxidase subunit IV family protein [Pyrinomonadaceae bacterium]|jgi:cytochrome c oxidase subunit 4